MIARAVPLWLDLLCVGIGALQGALFAVFYKRFDLVGVIAVALITGLGGGVLRDVVCRVTPQIFSGGPLYATATAIGSTFFVLLEKTSLNLNVSVAISALTIVIVHMTSVKFRIHLKPALSSLDFEQREDER